MRRNKVLVISVYPYKSKSSTKFADRLPLGPLYALAGVKRANPSDLKFVDLNTVNPDFCIEDQLDDFQPDLVAIGIHSAAVFSLACQLALTVRLIRPNALIVAGGMFPSSQPEFCLQREVFDYVLKGEVDNSIALLLACIQRKKTPVAPGLIKKEPGTNGTINLCRQDFPDLNKLPRIPEKGFDITSYSLIDPLISDNDRTLNISSIRGCPHQCAFCCYRIIGNGNRRIRDAVLLKNDLESINLEYGIRQFNFVDDDFLCSIKRTKKFCKLINSNDFLWRCQSRVDSFKPENLSSLGTNLFKAGCRLISFGIESGDEELLQAINKPIDLNWANRVCRSLMDIGIAIRIYIIVGLPYQTMESVNKTKHFLRKLNPTSVSVEIFVPHPGSPIGDNLDLWGIHWETDNLEKRIQRLDWLRGSKEDVVSPSIRTNWMSAHDISQARDEILSEWPPGI